VCYFCNSVFSNDDVVPFTGKSFTAVIFCVSKGLVYDFFKPRRLCCSAATIITCDTFGLSEKIFSSTSDTNFSKHVFEVKFSVSACHLHWMLTVTIVCQELKTNPVLVQTLSNRSGWEAVGPRKQT